MSEQEDRERRGQKCLDAAREARFASTGEPHEAADLADVEKERKALLHPIDKK